MVKIVFFIIILIMIFPLFFVNEKFNKVKKTNEIKAPVEIITGNFKKYTPILEMQGRFEKLNLFKKYLEIENLEAKNLIKKEEYFAKWALNEKDKITAKNAIYKNSDYKLTTIKAIYLKNEKTLKGGKFHFVSIKARGEGESFKVDKNRHIFAKNITYYIKVKE